MIRYTGINWRLINITDNWSILQTILEINWHFWVILCSIVYMMVPDNLTDCHVGSVNLWLILEIDCNKYTTTPCIRLNYQVQPVAILCYLNIQLITWTPTHPMVNDGRLMVNYPLWQGLVLDNRCLKQVWTSSMLLRTTGQGKGQRLQFVVAVVCHSQFKRCVVLSCLLAVPTIKLPLEIGPSRCEVPQFGWAIHRGETSNVDHNKTPVNERAIGLFNCPQESRALFKSSDE